MSGALTIGSTRRDYRWDFIVNLVTPLVNLNVSVA